MNTRNETRKSTSLNRLLYPLGTIVPAQTLQFQNIILPFGRNEQIVPEQTPQEQNIKQEVECDQRSDKPNRSTLTPLRRSKRKRKKQTDILIQDSDLLAVSTCIKYIQGAKKHLTDLKDMLTSIVNRIPTEVPSIEIHDGLPLVGPFIIDSQKQTNSTPAAEESCVSDKASEDVSALDIMNTDRKLDMPSYLRWLPSVLDSSRFTTANTIGRVVHMISSLSVVFPKVVKRNIKRCILNMPVKWSSFSFLLPSSMLAPKLAVQNVVQMSKLVTDSIAMLVSIERTVVEYIEQNSPRFDILLTNTQVLSDINDHSGDMELFVPEFIPRILPATPER